MHKSDLRTVRLICALGLIAMPVLGMYFFGFRLLGLRLYKILSGGEIFFLGALMVVPVACLIVADAYRDLQFIRRNRLRLVVTGIAVVGGVISVSLMAAYGDAAPTAATITLAATVATIGWVVQYFHSRDLHRKQHTMNVLLQFRTGTEFNRNEHNILSRFPSGQFVTGDDVKKLIKEVRDSSKYEIKNGQRIMPVLHSIHNVLNFYENIAFSIRKGDMDKMTIRETLRSIINAMYRKSKAVIRYYVTDEKIGNRQAYEHLRWLVHNWEDEDRGTIVTPTEWNDDDPPLPTPARL